MKHLFSVAALALGALLSTAVPGRAEEMRSVILKDIHGLFGGYAIWISRTGDSYIRIVQFASDKDPQRPQELRYKFRMTAEDIQTLDQVIAKNDFSKTDCSDQGPGTDQSLVYISADMGSRQIVACKFIRTNKSYPRFNAVAAAIYQIKEAHTTDSNTPESWYSTKQESWIPPGFDNVDYSKARTRTPRAR